MLEILQKLAYSSSEDTYEVNRRQLFNLHIEKVTTYYNKDWHPIRHEWVEGLKQQNFSLGSSSSTGEHRRWDHMQQPPRNSTTSLLYGLHMYRMEVNADAMQAHAVSQKTE